MESITPKIFVIVLNYNGAKVLPQCLASVFQSNYANLEVVVVDNNSQDDSFEKARLTYSRAHFIKNFSNLGFAKGNNVGIRFALEKFADYILLLNNDALLEKDTLANLMLTFSKNQTLKIANPLIMASDNQKIWFAGGKVDWKKMRTNHLEKTLSNQPYSSEYLTGCAMLINKDVFQKIGLLDERFFLYYEDADFSLRAKRAGFDLKVIPTAKVCHLEKSNTENKAKIYWLVLSGLLFFKIHASFIQKLWLIPYLLLRKLKNFYLCTFKNDATAKDVRKAYRDYKKF